MGKKSRRTRQRQQLQSEGHKQDAEVWRLADELFQRTSSQPSSAAGDDWDEFVAIGKIVDQIIEKQKPVLRGQEAASESSSRADRFPAFKEWLAANGVDIQCIDFVEFPDVGFGVKAVTDIQQHETFLVIPQKLMITSVTANESALGLLITADRLLESMPNVALAVHLLCEKYNPDSFWQPYIDVLPETYTTPLYYTADEIKLLDGSPAFRDAISQSKSIARQYSYLLRLFRDHPNAKDLPLSHQPFTYDDYRWAVSSVMTRQNKIPLKGGNGYALALIPGWDMCNHSEGEITTDFSLSQQCCKCYAMEDFPAGSQVVMFYGPRTSLEFLVSCGFVHEKNTHNRLKMKLGVSKGDPLFAMKVEVLSRLSIPGSAGFYISGERIPLTTELLAFLRVFCMTHEDLMERLQGDQATALVMSLRDPQTKVNDENERNVYSFLQTRLTLLLHQYKSTIDEDVELLGKGELSVCAADAVKLRKQDKEILVKAVEFVRSRLESLQGSV